MKANSVIRAVASLSFGASVYFAITMNGTSQAAEEIQHKVEKHKIVVTAAAPQAVRTVQETSEKFVVSATPSNFTPSPKPVVLKASELAEKRNKELQAEAKGNAIQARLAKEKAAREAKKKAEEAIAKAKKEKAEKERKEKEEKERKRREAAAVEKARKALRGVPVRGGHVGAGFGEHGPWARYHTGVDITGVGYGAAVRAVAPGRIIYAGNSGNWAGNHVVIKHTNGKKTLYAHMSAITRRTGRVDTGDQIGRVGESGRAFGVHLHLELYPAGATAGDVYTAINPVPWLRARGIRL